MAPNVWRNSLKAWRHPKTEADGVIAVLVNAAEAALNLTREPG